MATVNNPNSPNWIGLKGHGDAFMAAVTKHTVYNAATGICLLDAVTEGQFYRWYDHHADFRSVRELSEVNPEFRDLYEAISDRPGVHWLVQD